MSPRSVGDFVQPECSQLGRPSGMIDTFTAYAAVLVAAAVAIIVWRFGPGDLSTRPRHHWAASRSELLVGRSGTAVMMVVLLRCAVNRWREELLHGGGTRHPGGAFCFQPYGGRAFDAGSSAGDVRPVSVTQICQEDTSMSFQETVAIGVCFR